MPLSSEQTKACASWKHAAVACSRHGFARRDRPEPTQPRVRESSGAVDERPRPEPRIRRKAPTFPMLDRGHGSVCRNT
jgi:hypothetical protein